MSITDVRKDRSEGPSEPLNPLGPPEIRTKLHSGSHVARQRYTDGCLFEYKIAKGEPILTDPADLLPLFRGTVLATYQDGGYNYLAIWVHDGQSGCLCKDHIGNTPSELPYGSLLTPTIETLHADEHTGQSITCLRYTNGTMYYILQRLGMPWPRPPEHIWNAIEGSLVVSNTQVGQLAITAFWQPDGGRTKEAA